MGGSLHKLFNGLVGPPVTGANEKRFKPEGRLRWSRNGPSLVGVREPLARLEPSMNGEEHTVRLRGHVALQGLAPGDEDLLRHIRPARDPSQVEPGDATCAGGMPEGG